MNDIELLNIAQPIIDIYNDIQMDVIMEIAKRFDTYSEVAGTLEWQLKMLEDAGVLNQKLIKLIASYSKKTEKEILSMIKKSALANFDAVEMNKAYQNKLINTNYDMALKSPVLSRIINNTFIDTRNTLRLINTKCIESANKAYMDIVNKAFLETSSGLYSYTESISRSLRQFARKGIDGASYIRHTKDGDKVVNYSIEGVIRRDIVTATNSVANKASIEYAKSVGYEYVLTSQHMGARTGDGGENYTNHSWWQGKVFKLEGSDKYPNFAETCGYGDIQGIGGVNCRHRTFPFIPNVSEKPKQIDIKENEKRYQAEQGLRALERRIRSLRREYAVTKNIDKQTAKKIKADILSLSDDIQTYCDKNKLKRQFNRETVKENY